MQIKFNDLEKQWLAIKDQAQPRIEKLFHSSQYILGPDVEQFEDNFARYIGCKYAVGVASGTDAITIATNILAKDKHTLFITQANTFIATIFGILNGKNINSDIRIIDCDDYGQISTVELKETLKKYRQWYEECVIVPVHMYGGCADILIVEELADKYDCKILEDSAQAHGTICQNELKTGNIGDIAAFSFYPGKNLGCAGDGGMITTNNDEYYKAALELRNIGGIVKHEYNRVGYNSRLDSIQAIILDEKLKRLDYWNENRNRIAERYYQVLNMCVPYNQPTYCHYYTYHLFLALNLNPTKLTEMGIQHGKHYPETVCSTIAKMPDKTWDNRKLKNEIFWSTTPNADQIAKTHITLPMHPYMTDEEIKYVCDVIKDAKNDK